jgi:hypothetical protein
MMLVGQVKHPSAPARLAVVLAVDKAGNDPDNVGVDDHRPLADAEYWSPTGRCA